jgi:acyl-[acyl-carrier-protein] desaturase
VDTAGCSDCIISWRKLKALLIGVSPQLELPTLVGGPWTREAREQAVNKETRAAFEKYFHKAMKVRNWTPNELPIAEMHQLGSRLSDDTVTIIQAYLGVEDFVGDYVEDGLNLLHNNRARRNLQLAWGMEELKHAWAWELVLLKSGRRTEKELEDYRDEVLSHKWTMRENHPGLDTPLGVVCYTMVQERATYFNYDEMRKRIRSEYGYPEQSTPTERQNRVQVGAAGAFQIVGQDEIAHHGIFLEIVRIHMRYFPTETQEMLLRVFNGFTMPALHLIPDAADLEAAMRRTRLHTPRNQVTDVNNPILNALGLTNKKALEKAVQAAKMLPGQLGPEHTVLSQSGEWVLSMTPDDAAETESVAD